MKISPIAQGGSVQVNAMEGTISASRLERAKQIAAGQVPVEPSGDSQADRAQDTLRKIKMKTQLSTNRDDLIVEEPQPDEALVSLDKPDTIEPAEVVEETKPLSPQFAALAKAKRALQLEKAQLEKDRAELTQKSSVNTEDYVSKADIQSNPLSVLLGNGVTYDQLTEAIIAQQSANTPEITGLKAEIKALKEAMDNQFSSRDKAAEQQVLADLTKEANAITAEGDKFEAVREAKAQSDVVKLVHRVWQKGWPEQGFQPGEVMDLEKAAEFVENQLIDEALPFAKLSKVQKRLTPAQAAQVEAQIPSNKPNTKVMRTLTNRDTASPIMDKRARAIAAMQGTLKKG